MKKFILLFAVLLQTTSLMAFDFQKENSKDILKHLETLNEKQLDTLYRSLRGPDLELVNFIPKGNSKGHVIGEFEPDDLAEVVWGGKVFRERANGDFELKNKVLGGLVFAADVYVGVSWADKKQNAIIIDYSKRSLEPEKIGPFRWIALKPFQGTVKKVRDEVKMIKPGVYLGQAWSHPGSLLNRGKNKKRVLHFLLVFPKVEKKN